MTAADSPTSVRDRVVTAPAALRRRVLTDLIIAQLTEELGVGEGGEIHARSRFEEMGIDSKRALEFKELLEQDFACALPTTLMFDYPTPERLAGYIIDQVLAAGAAGQPLSGPAPAPADPGDGDIDIEELMRRKLEKY